MREALYSFRALWEHFVQHGGNMIIQKDKKGQMFIEWEQAPVPGGCKRAWIQHKDAKGKDWADTGRYLNVVELKD